MICKVCGNNKTIMVLNLGDQPLANKYPKNNKEIALEKVYPLNLIFCQKCKLVFIEKLISRKKMFEDYFYLSSVNKGLVRHFENLALSIKKSNFVVDIGSNDGILLKPLKKLNIKCLGIDPSKNVGKIANDNNLETIIGFFNRKIVTKVINKYGQPDTVVASSIFTHLENPKVFVKDLKKLLKKDGTFILEVEYLSNFIKKTQFERFYFDRPFYYSLNSIKWIFEKEGMSFVDVKKINIHGSSIRCIIKNSEKSKMTKHLQNLLNKENKFLKKSTFKIFQNKIEAEVSKFRNFLFKNKKLGKNIIGYGAPARVATISNLSKVDFKLIEYIIDDSPLKQNKFTPGTHIPIYSRKKIDKNKSYIIIAFAYEYIDDIKKSIKNINCKYYAPIPIKKI